MAFFLPQGRRPGSWSKQSPEHRDGNRSAALPGRAVTAQAGWRARLVAQLPHLHLRQIPAPSPVAPGAPRVVWTRAPR